MGIATSVAYAMMSAQTYFQQGIGHQVDRSEYYLLRAVLNTMVAGSGAECGAMFYSPAVGNLPMAPVRISATGSANFPLEMVRGPSGSVNDVLVRRSQSLSNSMRISQLSLQRIQTISPSRVRLRLIMDGERQLPNGARALASSRAPIDFYAQLRPTGEIDSCQGTISAGDYMYAFHSQTATAPDCPSGWQEMWSGFSFAGGMGGNGSRMSQQLDDPGSCLSEFRGMPFVECSISGGGPNRGYCDLETSNDFSMWLSTVPDIDQGPIIGPASTALIQSRVSRCKVCAGPSPIIAIHSQTTTVPACPAGWAEVRAPGVGGYSLLAMTGGDGGSNQNLSRMGSCVGEFRSLPFIECHGDNGQNARCDYMTGNDWSYYLSARDGNTGALFGPNAPSIVSRCNVCVRQ
ncbi:MAG: hypothetical protein AB7P04_02745 [Bacteriovoracia bacterium]